MSVSYFANMGSAALKTNVIGNIIIGVLSVVCSVGLGYFFGGYGVIAGWGTALALGSFYIIYQYHKKYKLGFRQLFIKEDWVIIATCLIYMICCFVLFFINNSLNTWAMFGISIFLFIGIILFLYFYHPLGKKLMAVIFKKSNPQTHGQ
jgi:O-antigen/teichoic acid export membrane protein